MLYPALAYAVITGVYRVVHVAVLASRSRTRLFLEDQPTPSERKRLMDVSERVASSVYKRRRTMQQDVPLGRRIESVPSDVVIDWVRSTSTLKNVKEQDVASNDWARLFARNLNITKEELVGTLSKAGREVIRRGRVRLDIVVMWVWRLGWRLELEMNGVEFYIHTDASPQMRGQELYASTFDMFKTPLTSDVNSRR